MKPVSIVAAAIFIMRALDIDPMRNLGQMHQTEVGSSHRIWLAGLVTCAVLHLGSTALAADPNWAAMGFEFQLPSGYTAHVARGIQERFEGMISTGPANKDGTFYAGIHVIVEPDAFNGGQWWDVDALVNYTLHYMSHFKADVLKTDFKLLEDVISVVAKQKWRSVTFEYDFILPNAEPSRWRMRIRERSLYVARGGLIYTITFRVDATEWNARVREFESFLSTFRFR